MLKIKTSKKDIKIGIKTNFEDLKNRGKRGCLKYI
jgi:hypothetical protein